MDGIHGVTNIRIGPNKGKIVPRLFYMIHTRKYPIILIHSQVFEAHSRPSWLLDVSKFSAQLFAHYFLNYFILKVYYSLSGQNSVCIKEFNPNYNGICWHGALFLGYQLLEILLCVFSYCRSKFLNCSNFAGRSGILSVILILITVVLTRETITNVHVLKLHNSKQAKVCITLMFHFSLQAA